jgi:hypothetical protein
MGDQHLHIRRFGRLAVMALAACAGFVSAVSLAQVMPAPAVADVAVRPLVPGFDNPLNRNPRRRSGFSDAAPVSQDSRNSSSRPTLPAASPSPDPRSYVPPPDPSRDARI